jgi:hypothetical protein
MPRPEELKGELFESSSTGGPVEFDVEVFSPPF